MGREPSRRISLEEIALGSNRVFVTWRGTTYTISALNAGLVAVSEWRGYQDTETCYYWTNGKLYDGRGWNLELLIWFIYRVLR